MKILFFLMAFTVFAFGSQTLAGSGVSGGGGAYVCRAQSGKILKSLLVDLWEASSISYPWPNGYTGTQTIVKSMAPVADQFDNAIKKLATAEPLLAKSVAEQWAVLAKNINWLPDGVSIMTPTDLSVDYFPTDCFPEGMMRYNAVTSQLDIRKDIFEKLETNTDIAAAQMHEAVYKVFRDMDVFQKFHQKSNLSRAFVGCIFSDSTDCLQKKDTWQIPVDGKLYQCISNQISVFLWDEIKPPPRKVPAYLISGFEGQSTSIALRYLVGSKNNYYQLTPLALLKSVDGPLMPFSFIPLSGNLEFHYSGANLSVKGELVKHENGAPVTVKINTTPCTKIR